MQPTHCARRHHLTLGGLENQLRNADTLATATAVRNTLSFAPDPGVSWLLPALRKCVGQTYEFTSGVKYQTLHSSDNHMCHVEESPTQLAGFRTSE